MSQCPLPRKCCEMYGPRWIATTMGNRPWLSAHELHFDSLDAAIDKKRKVLPQGVGQCLQYPLPQVQIESLASSPTGRRGSRCRAA